MGRGGGGEGGILVLLEGDKGRDENNQSCIGSQVSILYSVVLLFISKSLIPAL